MFLYNKAHLRSNAPSPEPEVLRPIVVNCESHAVLAFALQ